jgi:hypothetical protein
MSIVKNQRAGRWHNGLHGVIFQKMLLFITTAVKTSNPVSYLLSYGSRTSNFKYKIKKKVVQDGHTERSKSLLASLSLQAKLCNRRAYCDQNNLPKCALSYMSGRTRKQADEILTIQKMEGLGKSTKTLSHDTDFPNTDSIGTSCCGRYKTFDFRSHVSQLRKWPTYPQLTVLPGSSLREIRQWIFTCLCCIFITFR